MESVIVHTPTECVEAIKQSTFSTYAALMSGLDTICTKYKFKLAKENGDKDYIYLECYKAGTGTCKEESQKVRHTHSKKTGIH